ncbi:hypothetical protein NADFUDRAFT_64521 [Nadsonia fulvescens var. elongata DSM 6958]|uniref:LMBR1-domain-containing protein n=1 Tax=Nadsonia fulvescens var. elongata DSM 6958 TaxID=857566 RepID=A0A1E3PR21_9ASCO|nr:hypothetical protein NADFUDRAFT_64521 [Nadsonia fulvescens var. elongata DSM 6958]
MDALKQNLRYQLILLAAGLIGLVYLALTTGLRLTTLKSLSIALSYSYALILAILFMGNGLVTVPRRKWHGLTPQARLEAIYKIAPNVHDTWTDARDALVAVVEEIQGLAPFRDSHREFGQWISELLTKAQDSKPLEVNHRSNVFSSSANIPRTIDRAMITENYLAGLSKRLKRVQFRYVRYTADWHSLVKRASKNEDVIHAFSSSSTSGGLVFRLYDSRLAQFPRLTRFYYTQLDTLVNRGLATIYTLMSIIIVFSELAHGTQISPINFLISRAAGFTQQVLSSIFLGYMLLTAIASLARIRVFNVYALVPHKSDAPSLIFYAMYVCRLTVPLSYNYLMLITARRSVFEDFLGHSINLTPLGTYYNDTLPRLVIIPVCLTIFNFYDKIRSFLGFDFAFDDNDDDTTESGNSFDNIEGRNLVARELSTILGPSRGVTASYSDSRGYYRDTPSPIDRSYDNTHPNTRLLGGGNVNRSEMVSDRSPATGLKGLVSSLSELWPSSATRSSLLPQWSNPFATVPASSSSQPPTSQPYYDDEEEDPTITL